MYPRPAFATALTLLMGIGPFLLASLHAADAEQQAAQRPQRRPNPALAPIEDTPGLPRVLLLGDSISIGYTLPVREELKAEANVHRPSANCGPTTRGLEGLDRWLGKGQWDVIHFNWGLHDLKYIGPDGKGLADPKAADSRQQVPPEEYKKNLRELVHRLKKSGAKLIWCTTTPVPEGASGRIPGDADRYNAIAAEIMREEHVAIDDLYSFAKPRLAEIQRPANVHFTDEGSAILAKQVAGVIRQSLPEKKSPKK